MPNLGRPHGVPRPMGKTSHRPRSAGPLASGALDGAEALGCGSMRDNALLKRLAEMDVREAEERLARVIGKSGRPFSAAPGEERIRRGPASCAVCRTEPMIFRECPECRARYCSSGCLQSWYDYQKPSRAPALEVSIVDSHDSDNLTVVELHENLDDDGMKIGTLKGKQWETGVTRIAGGFAIVEKDSNTADSKTRRWGITSVDGWALGTPGPGPDWRPSKGVRLKLEALGSCQVCENQFALPEYICNSASRPSSASRRSSNSVQKPRVKMVDASTQTEVRSGLCRAQAAVAGDALAALALPVEVEGTSELVLTAEPYFARCQVRSALAAVASVAGVARANEPSGQIHHDSRNILEQLKQLKASLPPSPSHVEQDQRGQDESSSSRPRVLGHRQRAAVPTFKDGIPSFQAGAASALASGAVDAVHKFLDEGSTKSASSGSPSRKHLTNARQVGESDEIESVLLRGRAGELQGLAPIYDAIANMGGLLSASLEAPKEVGKTPPRKILSVLGIVSRLLQSSGSAWNIPVAPDGRPMKPMKFRDYWRTPSESAKAEAPASGWNLLQEALTALNTLVSESSSLLWTSDASETMHFPTWCQKDTPVEAFRCSKCKTYFHTECNTCGAQRPRTEDWEEFLSNAVRSIARIALFLDAKDIAEEDAEKARIEEEARARAEAEAHLRAQAEEQARLAAEREAQLRAEALAGTQMGLGQPLPPGGQQLGQPQPPLPAGNQPFQQMAPQPPPLPPGGQPLQQMAPAPPLPPGSQPLQQMAPQPPLPPGGQPLQQIAPQPPLPPGSQPLQQVAQEPPLPPGGQPLQQMAPQPPLPLGGQLLQQMAPQPPLPPSSQPLQPMAPQPPLPPSSQPLGQQMVAQPPPPLPPGSQPLGHQMVAAPQHMGETSPPGPLPPPIGGQQIGQQMVAQPPLPPGGQPMPPQPAIPLPPSSQPLGQQMVAQAQPPLPLGQPIGQQMAPQPPLPPGSQPLGQQMSPPPMLPPGSQPFGQQMGVQQPLLAPGGQLLGQQDAIVPNQNPEAPFNQNMVDMYLNKNVPSAPSAVQEQASAPAPAANLQQAMGNMFAKKRR